MWGSAGAPCSAPPHMHACWRERRRQAPAAAACRRLGLGCSPGATSLPPGTHPSTCSSSRTSATRSSRTCGMSTATPASALADAVMPELLLPLFCCIGIAAAAEPSLTAVTCRHCPQPGSAWDPTRCCEWRWAVTRPQSTARTWRSWRSACAAPQGSSLPSCRGSRQAATVAAFQPD